MHKESIILSFTGKDIFFKEKKQQNWGRKIVLEKKTRNRKQYLPKVGTESLTYLLDPFGIFEIDSLSMSL